MRKGEWPLVIFTLLVQMAIGLFFLLTAFRSFIPMSTATNSFDNFYSAGYWIIILLLITGVIAGTFHLGRPKNARLAMANLKKSWLSREMFLGLSFGLFTLTLGLVSWLEIRSPLVWNLLLIGGSIVAIALLYAISRIYMLRTVPTWNSITVTLSFFATSLLLGSILFSIFVAIQGPTLLTTDQQSTVAGKFVDGISTGSLALMFVQIILGYVMFRGFRAQVRPADHSLGNLWAKYRLFFMFRLGFGLIGIALYVNILEQVISHFHSEGPWAALLFGPFFLVFLSEASGRVLFYASYKSAGI
jgi:anaerobic dimethyl sulfoxide reductase subunit C (anchor subunit)